MEKLSKAICIAIIVVLMLRLVRVDARGVPPEERINAEPFIVECTAYCDEGITASGKPTVAGKTIAGAREWMGCMALIYGVKPDGGIGEFIGMYQMEDTGYGRDGDIQRGAAVDIFMSDYDDCIQWGRRQVYVQIIKGKG